VATADPPMPFEKKFANMALDAHIEKQQIPPSPVAADEPNFLAGASIYGIRLSGMPSFKTKFTARTSNSFVVSPS